MTDYNKKITKHISDFVRDLKKEYKNLVVKNIPMEELVAKTVEKFVNQGDDILKKKPQFLVKEPIPNISVWNAFNDANETSRFCIWRHLSSIYILCEKKARPDWVKKEMEKPMSSSSIFREILLSLRVKTLSQKTTNSKGVADALMGLKSTSLGSFANKIASKYKNDGDCKDLLSGLINGGGSNENMANMFKKIAGDVQQELNQGGIKQQDLMNDAQKFITSFLGQNGKGAGGLGNLMGLLDEFGKNPPQVDSKGKKSVH